MRFFTILAVVFALAIAASAAEDEFSGAWKVNAEKSKMNSGSPGAAGSMKIDVIADGYQIKIGNGETLTLHLDGKDYPREPFGIAKAVGADAVSARRVSPHTIETTFKREGKAVATVTREVSAAGRVLTATTDSMSVGGEKRHTLVVFDKQ
jgi:hypothetical protein